MCERCEKSKAIRAINFPYIGHGVYCVECFNFIMSRCVFCSVNESTENYIGQFGREDICEECLQHIHSGCTDESCIICPSDKSLKQVFDELGVY